RHGVAIPACQYDGQALATTRGLASSQRIAAGAQTCRSAALLLCPSIQEESAPVLGSALAVSASVSSKQASITSAKHPRRLGIELGEGLEDVVGGVEECSHGPGLAGALVRCRRVQDVFARARVGAGDDTPTAAVPLFDHRLKDTEVDEHRSHRPDVVGGDDG